MTYSSPNPSRFAHTVSTVSPNNSVLHGFYAGVTYVTLSANTVYYVPVLVPTKFTVTKLGRVLGSGTSSGTLELGLYTAGGARVVSTGTQNSGTSTIREEVWDVTDTVILPGLYYLAIVTSGATSVGGLTAAAPLAGALGVRSESVGSVALPATASWAVEAALGFFPILAAEGAAIP